MSNSREAGISLSESLTAAMSQIPESTVKTFKKDANNLAGANKKIKQEACKEYLKEYKKYVNREIDSVTHPVTKKQLTRKDRIDFIADQCKKGFNMRLSESESESESESKSSSSSSKSDEDNPYKLLKLPLDFKDIDKILEYPTKTIPLKNKHLMSLFKEPNKLTTIQATELLEKYLEDPAITDANILLYKKIRDSIKQNYVPDYNSFMNTKTFNQYIKSTYYEGSNYDPASIQLKRTRVEAIFNEAIKLFNEVIFYGDDNNTAEDFKRNTKENYYKYYTIEFMLLQIKKVYNGRFFGEKAQSYLKLIDKLIEGTINITDPDASISFEKSPDWSTSPDDPILKAEYKTKKETELARIMDAGKEYAGSINDADFYTMDEWKDMSLRKLKSVIVIPYEENGKLYANAYYVKSLYKAWYMAVKDRKSFLNPANRKEFTQTDKKNILEVIQHLHPGLKEPKYGTTGGRSDIIVTYTNDYTTTYFINIYYKYSCQETYTGICKHLLLQIKFPYNFIYTDDNRPDDDSVVPLAYNPTFLFDMINNLMRQNKVIGKKIPFKLSEPFKELSNLNRMITKVEYMRFFDKLRLML